VRRRKVLFALTALAIGLYAAHGPLLRGAANVLIAYDAPEPSTYIVLLSGDPIRRPRVVADLVQQGVAKEILLPQVPPNELEQRGLVPDRASLQIQMLESYGVRRTAVIRLTDGPGVTSTYDEAVAVRMYLASRGRGQRITLVTGAFGTRRARYVFRRVLRGLDVTVRSSPAPQGGFDASNWWTYEDGLIVVFNEYVKLGMYLIKY
jgi:uncharacterized SAM-binding protein YcdF (DUF218 family)